ncbi:HAD-IA family hydrolase [Rhodopseudomonas palustris]|uniref:Uncharacterized protein n=1 Tax=Rhodopseudomonas palustris TaxID=1076 RepID=A0A418VH61_RHOPL|nr:HAD-IA family hydrolase [Rhodopseudomonas palustris]RJF75458.1 hypothetical protein D4Q52_09775 [Rhodopseudomonas palustris]
MLLAKILDDSLGVALPLPNELDQVFGEAERAELYRLIRQREAILSNWKCDDGWLTEFSSIIGDADVVSFDVFDTALTRVVEAPVDVFALMERLLILRFGASFRGFSVAREAAEKKARERARCLGRIEITFSEILAELVQNNPSYKEFSDIIARLELLVERLCLLPVLEIRKAVDLAISLGKRVIFISDMYHNSRDIRGFLVESGYSDSFELLVSSETGATKAAGVQWEIVRRICGAESKVVHIGDDEWSDVQSATCAGIVALQFVKAISNRRRGGALEGAIVPLSLAARKAQLWSAQQKVRQEPSETMRVLGRSWGAVVIGSYIKWLKERAEKAGVRKLYFCARDGYLVRNAWIASGLAEASSIQERYLYISRRALNLAAGFVSSSSTELSKIALDTLAQSYRPHSVLQILKRSNLDCIERLVHDAQTAFGSLDAIVGWPDGVNLLKSLFQRHSEEIYRCLGVEYQNAVRYLCQEGLQDGEIGLVDVGWHGTMQASIVSILRASGLKPTIMGFYFGLWPAAQSNRPRAGWMEAAFGNDYIPHDDQRALNNSVAILENLLSSSEGTTLGYGVKNGVMSPVLAPPNEFTSYSASLIEPFQTATLEGIAAIFKRQKDSLIALEELSLDAGMAALARLSLSPSNNELQSIGSIRHSGDFGHALFETLIGSLSNDSYHSVALSDTEWPIGTALAALNKCVDPESRSRLRQDICRQLTNYDERTFSQFL